MNVELHIERLVVEGLPIEEGARHALRATVEERLTSLLANQPLGGQPRPQLSASRISAMPVTYRHSESPQKLGNSVATSIAEVLS